MIIRRATLQDIPTIRAMADVVFRRTYAEILSPEQMEYMMEWMYSPASLTEQISGAGKSFFIAEFVAGECLPAWSAATQTVDAQNLERSDTNGGRYGCSAPIVRLQRTASAGFAAGTDPELSDANGGRYGCSAPINRLQRTAAAGYLSFELEGQLPDGRPLYHLQKLYVMPEYQHLGIGRELIGFVRTTLAEQNPRGCRVELNVNRGNPAVGFYERMGMRRDRQGDFPIGEGFYMNDYIYAMDI